MKLVFGFDVLVFVSFATFVVRKFFARYELL